MVQPPGQLVMVNVVAWLTVSGSGQYITRCINLSQDTYRSGQRV